MKKSQLNAIRRNYADKKLRNQELVLVKYDLVNDFKKSSYKSLTSYLKVKFREGVIKSWLEVYGEIE